jgi:hypothetical protein
VEYIIAIVVVAGVLLVWLDRNGRRIIADETRAAQTRFTDEPGEWAKWLDRLEPSDFGITSNPSEADFYLTEQEPETVETRMRSKR